jgi:hypothetical protein
MRGFKLWLWWNQAKIIITSMCLLVTLSIGAVWYATIQDLRNAPEQYKPKVLHERHLEWRLDRLEQKINMILEEMTNARI